MDRPKTLGALKEQIARTGKPIGGRSVKQELRDNLIEKLRTKEPIFPGIIGYDDTVIPQVINALLSRHDLLFLGLRGQAKTRMIRMLPTLLDEWVPVVAGSDLPDDPLAPQFTANRKLVEEQGNDTPIAWLHRDQRFHEKLATPDVTIADLIGEIDLVRHAEGRRLDDEGVIHYGLIPRTNRGIFTINELPDLAPRIQVGLFNALEERDVQIRGFPVRIQLDVCMAFTANPEDYTNRSSIVTPLKDRIGSVIRTHYPLHVDHAMAITRGSAWLDRETNDWTVEVPHYMHEIVEEFARLARKSPHINQQSGVSVRASIAGAELLISNAERRCLRHGEKHVVPRISDLQHISSGCRGKIELMLAEDERAEDQLINSILGESVKTVYERYADLAELEGVVECFADESSAFEIGDEVSTHDLVQTIERSLPLKKAAAKFCLALDQPFDQPAHLAAAAELILETLYVDNRLSKYAYHGKTFFKR